MDPLCVRLSDVKSPSSASASALMSTSGEIVLLIPFNSVEVDRIELSANEPAIRWLGGDPQSAFAGGDERGATFVSGYSSSNR